MPFKKDDIGINDCCSDLRAKMSVPGTNIFHPHAFQDVGHKFISSQIAQRFPVGFCYRWGPVHSSQTSQKSTYRNRFLAYILIADPIYSVNSKFSD